METNRKSVLLTRKELERHLKPIVEGIIKDSVSDALNGVSSTLAMVEFYLGFSLWPLETLFEQWCELYSEKFLDDNPAVMDVLFVRDKNKVIISATNFKEWICSRDD